MSIQVEDPKIKYSGGGTTGPFPITFTVDSVSEVEAIKTDSFGQDTDLVNGSDFTVDTEAMNITTASVIESGSFLTIYRNVSLNQNRDFRNTGFVDVEEIESGLDKLTMITQQIQEEVSRSVKVGMTSSATPDELIEEIESAAASSAANAAIASEKAIVATDKASDSATSAQEAKDAVANVNLPTIGIGEAGNGLIVNPTGTGYIFGGDAAGYNVGTADNEIPTNSDVVPPLAYRPQTLVKAPATLIETAGGTYVEDPSQVLDTHTGLTSTTGTVSTSSQYPAGNYYSWHAFDKNNSTGWLSASGNIIGAQLTYTLSTPKVLLGYKIVPQTPTHGTGRAMTGWTFKVNDVVVDTQTGISWASVSDEQTFMLSTPSTDVNSFEIEVTAGGDGTYVGIAEVTPIFGTSSSNTLSVNGPLKIAMAEGAAVVIGEAAASQNVILETTDGVPAGDWERVLAASLTGGNAALTDGSLAATWAISTNAYVTYDAGTNMEMRFKLCIQSTASLTNTTTVETSDDGTNWTIVSSDTHANNVAAGWEARGTEPADWLDCGECRYLRWKLNHAPYIPEMWLEQRTPAIEGETLIDGIHYIYTDRQTDGSLQFASTTDIATLGDYDADSITWTDNKTRFLLGWAEVSSGAIAQLFSANTGTRATINPVATTLPNPYPRLPVMAAQDGALLTTTLDDITGINTGGGDVLVWRAD